VSGIRSFTDLVAWQEAHKLALMIYSHTKKFPAEEKFGLTNQIRRAVISITSNIAEGFSRNSSKEKVQFCYIALGSLTEVQNQLIVSRDLGYLSSKDYAETEQQCILVSKLINGMIKSARNMARP
jgi:four helix bundle protein